MQRHGWMLLFHACAVGQLQTLHAAVQRSRQNDPAGFESNANVKLFRALSQLILEGVPGDPAREEYRQGNSLGQAHRHWRWARIGRHFRLFFRYDSKARVIVYAWVNDMRTLRAPGSQSDPDAMFEKTLGQGNPSDDGNVLLVASQQNWSKLE